MSLELNGRLLRERITLGNFPTGGVVGANTATVDIISDLAITQTTPNQVLSLPVPSDARNGLSCSVANAGTVSYSMHSVTVLPTQFATYEFHNGTWRAPAAQSAADFWRDTTAAVGLPDGSADYSEAIRHQGQVLVDSTLAQDSGMTLEKLVTATAGSVATAVDTLAIGANAAGKVKFTNAVAVADNRAVDTLPNAYPNAAVYEEFKQAATIGLTAANGINNSGTYAGLTTQRKYGFAGDFSGGQVRQEATLDDGRVYYRMSTSATTWGPWMLSGEARADLRGRLLLNGVMKASLAGELRWTNRLIVMTTGSGTANGNDTASGYFDINMPADGFAVPVAGGATRAVVAATANDPINTGGILLNQWESLWYKTVKGAANTFVPGNLLIQPYNVASALTGTERDGWILIASRDDGNYFRLGTGDDISLCMQIGQGGNKTLANWAAMKQRAMGDGYFYSPGGNTGIPLAFGFTGAIRWIDAGIFVGNNQGFLDANPATRTAGTAILGVNGAAARTWRTMTVAEKPGWFGGAQRGNNPILAASSTVVDLNDNETLFFVPNINSTGGGPADAKYVVAGYSGAVTVPPHWMPIASRQTTGANSTIQVLVGGVQFALKANDARYMSNDEGFKDAALRKAGITHKGLTYARRTTATLFAGTAANGVLQGSTGQYISWTDNRLIYGISDGYASFGTQYSYVNVPSDNAQIPVVLANSNITRVVKTISGRRYIPLGPWEALYWIPPAYTGGTGSVDGDFVISYYNGNSGVPPSAVLIAKAEASGVAVAGNSIDKSRIKFADGTYIQSGAAEPISTAVEVENDHAQGSGDWRPVVIAGQTGPGMTAAMPAVVGIQGPYSAPWEPRFRYVPLDSDPRGTVHLRGLVLMNANVTASSPNIAFLPGVQVIGNPIVVSHVQNTTMGDNKMIPVQLRFSNATINGSVGTVIQAYVSSFDPAVNPYFTLGLNGAASPAGTSQWLTLDNITLHQG
jgi:hypothetical protein